MNSVETRFLEPLDVLLLRGNKLFGDPGSYGESLVPPWPSVAAGAIRSRMLVDDGVDLAAFARGEILHPMLGTPSDPGDFVVTAFSLARRFADGHVEALMALPADLVVSQGNAGSTKVRTLAPAPLAKAGRLSTSYPLSRLPVLADKDRSKPESGYWLTESGWKKYLAGDVPGGKGDLVKSDALWKVDHRVGVGLDADTRRAADGRLFSVQAVVMVKRGHRIDTDPATGNPITADYDVGFLTVVTGARPPVKGTLRLGGDGRAAAIHVLTAGLPEPDYEAIAAAGRCRVVLSTPGLFAGGWLPTGVSPTEDGGYRFDLHGIRAKLVCAAVARFETVSGWDLAKWRPKAAQRAAPAGSVYWLDEIEGSADALRKLAEKGLWSESVEDAVRRAEGFNRIVLAAY